MSVRSHAHGCFTCPLQPGSIGFVADSVPAEPKIWVMKYHPTSAEVENDAEKLANQRFFWERDYLAPAGLKWDDIAICHVLRCRPKREPTGKVKKSAENICRQYDSQSGDREGKLRAGGIHDAEIDCFIITFDHLDCIDVPSRKLFVRRAFEIASILVARGHKPMVLMGKEAAQLIYPSLFAQRTRDREVGFKSWVGHYWFGGFPFGKPMEPKVAESNLVHIKMAQDKAIKSLTTKYRLNDL